MFETASFHITKPCNMKCKFCYATFEDFHVGPMMNINVAKNIVEKLKNGGLEKITFAGGEPLLYKKLSELIEYSKKIGLTTSIITNGSLLTDRFLSENVDHLDWVGVSIDSLNQRTNELIGRDSKINYHRLVQNIKQFGYRLKINTVVNIFNQYELLAPFILWAEAERWKVFDTLRVEGQNDEQFEAIRSSPTGFEDFVKFII